MWFKHFCSGIGDMVSESTMLVVVFLPPVKIQMFNPKATYIHFPAHTWIQAQETLPTILAAAHLLRGGGGWVGVTCLTPTLIPPSMAGSLRSSTSWKSSVSTKWTSQASSCSPFSPSSRPCEQQDKAISPAVQAAFKEKLEAKWPSRSNPGLQKLNMFY